MVEWEHPTHPALSPLPDSMTCPQRTVKTAEGLPKGAVPPASTGRWKLPRDVFPGGEVPSHGDSEVA